MELSLSVWVTKGRLVGSDELAAMSDLFKAKCGKFEVDIRKTLSSERGAQRFVLCRCS